MNRPTDGLTVYQTAPLPALGIGRVIVVSGEDAGGIGADAFLWFDRGSAKPRARRFNYQQPPRSDTLATGVTTADIEATAKDWAQAEIYAVVGNSWRELLEQHQADLQSVPPDWITRWWLLQPDAEARRRMTEFFGLVKRSRCPTETKAWLERVEAMAPMTTEPIE